MYIAAEHAQFLDVDPTGADSRVIDEISHHVLVYLADCQKKRCNRSRVVVRMASCQWSTFLCAR